MPVVTHAVLLSIEFGDPVALDDLAARKSALRKRGVYLLTVGPPEDPAHLGTNVFYIGKAVSETIYSRAEKHANSIAASVHRSGTPKTRPGKKLQAFRERMEFQLTNLWVVPGFMQASKSFEVSCAEEWLLWSYKNARGAAPEANTYSANDL